MRGPWIWVVVIVAGVVAVTGVVALVGRDDSEDQTVAAGEWADTVCGAVAVWRGQIESIVDGIRNPDASGSLGVEEPQSETPQGRTTFIRDGLEQTVEATETMITGMIEKKVLLVPVRIVSTYEMYGATKLSAFGRARSALLAIITM